MSPPPSSLRSTVVRLHETHTTLQIAAKTKHSVKDVNRAAYLAGVSCRKPRWSKRKRERAEREAERQRAKAAAIKARKKKAPAPGISHPMLAEQTPCEQVPKVATMLLRGPRDGISCHGPGVEDPRPDVRGAC